METAKMKLALVSTNPAVEFSKGIQEYFVSLGHNCIRTTRLSQKRLNLRLDINPSAWGKVEQFARYMHSGVKCVPNTENRVEAAGWLIEDATVLCRTLTNANSGRGIVMATTIEELVDCKLYTRYILKKREYRVHVFNGKVVHIQEKKLRTGFDPEKVNFQIRNYDNGWVFCHKDLVITDQNVLEGLALAAVRACNYMFGAVDVIYNEKRNEYYVLETNSRPACEGTTAAIYGEQFLALANTPEEPVTDVKAYLAELELMKQYFKGIKSAT